MNLKSATMATGLVLTFAAGAWLSTIMLAPPQRPNRVAVQEQAPAPSPSPQLPPPRSSPRTVAGYAGIQFHPAAASAITPDTRRDASGASTCSSKHLRRKPVVTGRSTAGTASHRNRQPPEPQPPAIAEAPPPESRKPAPGPHPGRGGGTGTAGAGNPLVPPVETAPEAGHRSRHRGSQRSGHAAAFRSPSSATRIPSTAFAAASRRNARPNSVRTNPSATGLTLSRSGDVTSRHSRPARTSRSRSAASRTRPMRPVLCGVSGAKGWEAFVVDWANGTGQIWKVVRVGRYQTEAQAVSASAELMSAANLRGNVIKVR